jgi:hypothetical protein
MPSVGELFLISCVAMKLASPAPAKDLYQSHWFVLARRYVEARGAPWFILSAKHGLVGPDDLIEPYELTLNTMDVADRRAWARRVQAQMEARLPQANRIIVFAGQRYREFLMDYLRRRASAVHVPMKGLRIGEQLSWLSRAAP